MTDNLEVEALYFYPVENAKRHHTENYEVVYNQEFITPVLRRGQKFNIAIRFSGRQYSNGIDKVSVIFNFGEYVVVYFLIAYFFFALLLDYIF